MWDICEFFHALRLITLDFFPAREYIVPIKKEWGQGWKRFPTTQEWRVK